MPALLISLSLWLHSLATVVFIGHYVLLALVYHPALFKTNLNPEGAPVFREIAQRSRPWLYAALGVFMVTGYLLMVNDPSYTGIGDFSSAWSWLMLIKHVIVIGMLAAGFWFNGVLKVGSRLTSSIASPQALSRYRTFTNGMALSGVLVLLLTVLVQGQ